MVKMGGNILLFHFMVHAIWNSLEEYYLLVENLIILAERVTPPPPCLVLFLLDIEGVEKLIISIT